MIAASSSAFSGRSTAAVDRCGSRPFRPWRSRGSRIRRIRYVGILNYVDYSGASASPVPPAQAAEDVADVRQKFRLSEAGFEKIVSLRAKTLADYPNSRHLFRIAAPLVCRAKAVASARSRGRG